MKTEDNIDILLGIIRFIQKAHKGFQEKGKETHATHIIKKNKKNTAKLCK